MKNLKYLIIDLDNTVYPESSGVFSKVNHRINCYLEEKMGFPHEEVNPLRVKYFSQYGTTLRGLMIHYEIDPKDYLDYVHDVDLNGLLSKNEKLNRILKEIPQEKIIFTNGSKAHAENVLKKLEILENFTLIFDIVAMDYMAKPHPQTYIKVLEKLNAEAERCLYIDDIEKNLIPAKELGMKTVLVSDDGHNGKPYADFIIREIAEIEGLF